MKTPARSFKPERFSGKWGAHAPSRVPTGALAGRIGHRRVTKWRCFPSLRVVGGGADHCTRGRERSPANCIVPAKELIVWQKVHQFVLGIYRFTKEFPADERFGLTSQIRRAAVSVPANIAEGFPKRGANDKVRFY